MKIIIPFWKHIQLQKRMEPLLIVINTLATLIFLCIVIVADRDLLYDEPWYLEVVDLVHQKGLSSDFLRSLPGPAGPLHAWVHFCFEPITHLESPGVRLVNVFLYFGIILLLGLCLRRLGSSSAVSSAMSLIAIPMTWVVSGLALTEVPAMFFTYWPFFCSWYSMFKFFNLELEIKVFR